ncbi:MAG: molybdopterin molybdotransferase MoeA [Anaerolineales bacterium]|nr:molybdopterin molybdotransferase MoeA [Anaerolineales bacterium]
MSVPMISVAEAQRRLLAALPVCPLEDIPLQEAAGRVMGAAMAAPFASPRFDNSSMDGFAVRAADLTGASADAPVTLRVIGDQPAGGDFPGRVEAGQAVRIMTGASLPDGADAVAPVEITDAPGDRAGAELPASVQVGAAVSAGDYVRPAGEDFAAGDTLLPAGHRLRPQDAALLAMLGQAQVSVHRRPRVALFSSGDELLAPGEPLAPGKIYETNSFQLSALVQSCGAEVLWLGVARDEQADVEAHLQRAIALGADLILTSAGVSVGAFDYLREAVLRRGTLDFWKVNMRPGRPFTFGDYAATPYIGLPGNPASASACFEVFVRPALEHIAGVQGWQRRRLRGVLMEDITSDGRESYLRVQINQNGETPEILLTGHQGSGNLYSLVEADGLMIVPAGVTEVSAGSQMEVWPL